MNKVFYAKKSGKRAEIYLYEEIGEGWSGGITAKAFSDTMREIGDASALDIYINSPGGSVFDGVGIYNQIRRFSGEKVVHIDGIAASIASIIAMAGDEIRIAANGMIMIHDPWSLSIGTAAEMRKTADSLDKVRGTLLSTYVAKTGLAESQISDWMTAETWLDAVESVRHGFASSVTEEKSFKAEFTMLSKFNKVPKQFKRSSISTRARIADMEVDCQKIRGASTRK